MIKYTALYFINLFLLKLYP